jgi:hypothetical protein
MFYRSMVSLAPSILIENVSKLLSFCLYYMNLEIYCQVKEAGRDDAASLYAQCAEAGTW